MNKWIGLYTIVKTSVFLHENKNNSFSVIAEKYLCLTEL